VNLRFATWQAVSTKEQAKEDKVSLRVQLEKCLDVGQSRGWIHVRDYTVPGQSRTQFASLYHAEKNIPQLHDMLDAASRHEFDVLVVYDLNRFRSLMRQVFDVLCDYQVQLYILSDPREPVPTSGYTEEKKSEVALLVGLRDIISTNEVTNIQRHYRDKMPKRITEKGLHAGLGLPPYGYHKPPGKEMDRNAVLIQDPSQVRVLHQIKDWFFAGCSLTEIADRLNAQGVPSPRGRKWWYSIVRYLLSNPYYAGTVGFGMTKRIRIRRLGTVQRHKGTPITNEGKHQPIWDQRTYHRILTELEKRGKAHPGIKIRQLSRLLHCESCGSVLWAQTDQKGYHRWRCSSLEPDHPTIRDEAAIERVTAKIVHALTHLDELKLPTPADHRSTLNAQLRDLCTRKQRWMDLYETGRMSDEDLVARIEAINTDIRKTEKDLAQAEHQLHQAATTREVLNRLAVSVETLPAYYAHGPKPQVNADLRTNQARVIVKKDKSVELEWR
jgi:DNA invertase Pin-like site-specific DNA recombinase